MCESRTWDALQAIKFYMSASIYKSYYSIPFNSAVWHITSLLKFWFWQAPDLNMILKYIWEVGVNFALGACKLSIVNWIIFIAYIMHVNMIGEPLESFLFFFDPFFRIFRWFQHLTKICITCITFWWLWALHDVSLPNWMKYYSTREPILQKKSCSFLFAWLPFHKIRL